MLTPNDIRDLLAAFAAVIELDQIRVDALSAEKFHPLYHDGMWRRWRRYHLDYIEQLLPTVNAMPSAILQELTRIALSFPPAMVWQTAIDLFADAASGSCPLEEFETATLFFGWLIRDLRNKSEDSQKDNDAKALFMQWLPMTDPLNIAQDPECGYDQPTGFVS